MYVEITKNPWNIGSVLLSVNPLLATYAMFLAKRTANCPNGVTGPTVTAIVKRTKLVCKEGKLANFVLNYYLDFGGKFYRISTTASTYTVTRTYSFVGNQVLERSLQESNQLTPSVWIVFRLSNKISSSHSSAKVRNSENVPRTTVGNQGLRFGPVFDI